MSDIEIRDAKEEDVGEIHDLIKNVFNEYVAPGYSDKGICTFMEYIQIAKLKARFHDNQFMIVALKDNRMIGVIEAINNNHISLMFVKKQFHKKGVAKKLFDIARSRCVENRSTEISVNSSPYAVLIYKKLGFVCTGAEKIDDGIRYTPMKYEI